jgi:hypothetical protein
MYTNLNLKKSEDKIVLMLYVACFKKVGLVQFRADAGAASNYATTQHKISFIYDSLFTFSCFVTGTIFSGKAVPGWDLRILKVVPFIPVTGSLNF